MATRITRRNIATDDDRYGGYKKELFINSNDVAYTADKKSGYYTVELDDSYGRARSTIAIPEPDISYPAVNLPEPKRIELYNRLISEPKNKTVHTRTTRRVSTNSDYEAVRIPGFEAPTNYSTSETFEYSVKPPRQQIEEVAATTVAPTRRYSKPVKDEEFDEEKIIPRIARYDDRVQASDKKANAKKASLKSKDKNMLFIYIAIVLAVAVAIIATGIGIGVSTRSATALEDQLIEQRQVLAESEIELFRMQDPDYLAFRASQQGMTTIISYTQVPLIELQPPQNFDPPSNWFDRLSKSLSNFFGRSN